MLKVGALFWITLFVNQFEGIGVKKCLYFYLYLIFITTRVKQFHFNYFLKLLQPNIFINNLLKNILFFVSLDLLRLWGWGTIRKYRDVKGMTRDELEVGGFPRRPRRMPLINAGIWRPHPPSLIPSSTW